MQARPGCLNTPLPARRCLRAAASRQCGFTLVELAIVLVLGGLLVAGMLTAEAIASQSHARRLAADFNGVATSVQLYRDRFRALPGDDPGAAQRWQGAVSGDGNGALWRGAAQGAADVYDATAPDTADATTPETLLFWQHLRKAGLVPLGMGAASDLSVRQPETPYGRYIGVQANALGFPLALCMSGVPARAAISVESELDDGVPGTGRVRASDGPSAAGLPTSGRYVEDAGRAYLVCMAL